MSVSVCVLGSGSGGNCTAVWTRDTVLLIDAGKLAAGYIRDSLAKAGLGLPDVTGVLITHCHTDHIGDTTYRLCRHDGIPVYCSGATWRAALKKRSNRRLEGLEKMGLIRERPDEAFRVGDFKVTPFDVSHTYSGSKASSVGYTLQANGRKVAYATDLGHVTPVIEEQLAGVDILVMESNHDVRMELDSSRPRQTVEWVLGETGHLSNLQCAGALRNVIASGGRGPCHIVLAHLSEECNLPGLALSASGKALESAGLRGVNLIAARQKVPTPVLSAGP